jgi:hypothetical protein
MVLVRSSGGGALPESAGKSGDFKELARGKTADENVVQRRPAAHAAAATTADGSKNRSTTATPAQRRSAAATPSTRRSLAATPERRAASRGAAAHGGSAVASRAATPPAAKAARKATAKLPRSQASAAATPPPSAATGSGTAAPEKSGDSRGGSGRRGKEPGPAKQRGSGESEVEIARLRAELQAKDQLLQASHSLLLRARAASPTSRGT